MLDDTMLEDFGSQFDMLSLSEPETTVPAPSSSTQTDSLTDDHQSRPTSFLSLPPELRTYIYDLADDIIKRQCRYCLCIQSRSALKSRNAWTSGPSIPAGHTTLKCLRRRYNSAYLWVNRKAELAWDTVGIAHDGQVTQPVLASVSKEVRHETLAIFYGNSHFFFTFSSGKDKASGFEYRKTRGSLSAADPTKLSTLGSDKAGRDEASIMAYLKTIGPVSASMLTKLSIVCRSKDAMRYLEKSVLPEMRKLGVREGVVRVRRLEYPFCICEKYAVACLKKAEAEESRARGGQA